MPHKKKAQKKVKNKFIFFIFYCLVISNSKQKMNNKQTQSFNPKKYVSQFFSEDDIKHIKECFDIFDFDQSGYISTQQLVNTIRALGLDKQSTQILNIVNNHTNLQQLDFPTFLEIFGLNGNTSSQKTLQQLYETFDPKGTGSFKSEDFEKVAESIGIAISPTEIDQMIDFADQDRDGGISFQEFVSVITKQYPKI